MRQGFHASLHGILILTCVAVQAGGDDSNPWADSSSSADADGGLFDEPTYGFRAGKQYDDDFKERHNPQGFMALAKAMLRRKRDTLPREHMMLHDLNMEHSDMEALDAERVPGIAFCFTACGKQNTLRFMGAFQTLAAQLALDRANLKIPSPGGKPLYPGAPEGTVWPARAYVIIDTEGEKVLKMPKPQKFLKTAKDVVTLEEMRLTWILESPVARSALEESKLCALSKLYVPRLLAERESYLLFLDNDALVTGTVMPMMQAIVSQEAGKGKPPIFMSEEVVYQNCPRCGWYHYKPNDVYGSEPVMSGDNGFNSGLLGVNIDAWRSADMDAKVEAAFVEVWQGRLRIPFGEQDIVNMVARRHKGLIHPLPCEFNVRVNSQCHDRCTPRTPKVLFGSRQWFEKKWSEAYAKIVNAAKKLWKQVDDSGALPDTLPVSVWEMATNDFYLNDQDWKMDVCSDYGNDQKINDSFQKLPNRKDL